MEENRKAWNERHQALRKALEEPGVRKSALELFLVQHAMVHSAKLTKRRLHSFEDEILTDLSFAAWRYIPPGGNHSIAWIIWHLARIEDVTTSLLIANAEQVLHKEGWCRGLEIKAVHTGNGMTNEEIVILTNQINVKALREYRLGVARETRETVRRLKPAAIGHMVEPSRVQRVWEERAMLPEGKGIVEYWAKRTIAGLLLMPLTRHCFLHLNEAKRTRQQALTRQRAH